MLRRHHQMDGLLELSFLVGYMGRNLGAPPGPLPIVEGVVVLVRTGEVLRGGPGLL